MHPTAQITRHPGYLAEARRLMSLSAEDLRRDEAWVALVDGMRSTEPAGPTDSAVLAR